MNHAQYLDLMFEIAVRDDVGETVYYQLSGSFDPAPSAKARMRFKPGDLAFDLRDDLAGRGQIVGRDVVVDFSQVE